MSALFSVLEPVMSLGAPGYVTGVYCVHLAFVFWLYSLLGQSSAEVFLAGCGQCFIPGLNMMSFN